MFEICNSLPTITTRGNNKECMKNTTKKKHKNLWKLAYNGNYITLIVNTGYSDK